MPGKNPNIYYLCTDLQASGKAKLNLHIWLSYSLVILIYVLVHIKIKIYSLKHLNTDFPSDANGGHLVRSALSSFVSITLVLGTVALGVCIHILLNQTELSELKKSPYDVLVLIYRHAVPFAATTQFVFSYFIYNEKLRAAAIKQAKKCLGL